MKACPPDLPSNCSSSKDLNCNHSNYNTQKALYQYLLSPEILLAFVSIASEDGYNLLPPRGGIGQFALLPSSLEVVALSQAFSPESTYLIPR